MPVRTATRSCSISLRTFVSPTSGFASSSSTISCTSRPAMRLPRWSNARRIPTSCSSPRTANGPLNGYMTPTLIGVFAAGVCVQPVAIHAAARPVAITEATKRLRIRPPWRLVSGRADRSARAGRVEDPPRAPAVMPLRRGRFASRHRHDRTIFQHATLVGLGEHGLDRSHELARRIHTQLDGHAGARPHGLVDEIDVERVLERKIVWMVVRDVGFANVEPPRAALARAQDLHLLGAHRAHALGSPGPLSAAFGR